MTRKDYEAIAEVIAYSVRRWDTETEGNTPREVRQTIEEIANGIAEVFDWENPRFDADKFYRACGL